MGSEYHGTVQSRGLPLPGATVTATRDGRNVVTTTDTGGAFSFAALEDGTWTLAVQMAGFQTLSKEIGVAPNAPAPVFEMQFAMEELAAPAAPQAPQPRFV